MDRQSTANIVALTDQNYATWKIQLKMLLIRDNLFKIVDGTESAPTGEQDLVKFNSRRDKALSHIVLAIDPKLLYLVGDPTDPAVVWKTLQDTFQKKTWANKLSLKRKLYNLKLDNKGDLQSHLKQLIEIYDELAVIGEKIDDEDKVINLLASLPNRFSTLVTALEASENVPTWAVVTERLLHEDNKFKSKDDRNEKVLFSKKNNSGKEYSCYECGEPNHIRKNCSRYRNRMKSEKEKSKKTVNSAKKVESDDELTLLAKSQPFASAASESSESVKHGYFVLDSGATHHMVHDKSMFVNFEEINDVNIVVGDGGALPASGKGDVFVRMLLPQNKVKRCKLKNVLFVPKLAHNLISIPQMTMKNNVKAVFFENSCKILNRYDKLVAYGKRVGNLFVLDCERERPAEANVSTTNCAMQYLWHRRLCHIGFNNVRKIVKDNLVSGIDFKLCSDDHHCESCYDGKNHRVPFPTHKSQKNRKILDVIHSDLCGKIQPASIGGGSYFMTLIDDASRYCWVYVLKNKSDAFETFRKWKKMVENQYDRKVKVLRTDGGGEYVSNEFDDFLNNSGIIHQTTVAKTPQQNGLAERKNRTLVELIRCVISDSGLDKSFWGEALSTVNHVINRCPTVTLDSKTPYEVLNGRKPNIDYFKVFGSTAYMHIPKDERSKIDAKSKRCIFMGYSEGKKGYRLFNPETRKIVHSRDVIFDERKSGILANSEPVAIPNDQNFIEFTPESDTESKNDTEYQSNDEEYASAEDAGTEETSPQWRRSGRQRRPPDYYGEWTSMAYASNIATSCANEPTSYEEAIKGPESAQWRQAMDEEIRAMKSHKVWTLVKPTSNQKLIKCRWVFRKKFDQNGDLKGYKARLVAQGYSQTHGIDYNDTFSPVIRFETLRSIIAYSLKHDLKLQSMDVSSAFLNGNLEEQLYMCQPEGYFDNSKSNYVCKLDKAIYGLKQASKAWNDSFSNFLISLGFTQSDHDSCFFVKNSGNQTCYIALYVDDLLIACNSDDLLNHVKSKLCEKYKMKDLGNVNQFLGIKIVRSNDKISMDQSAFAQSLLEKYNFHNCKPVSTPVDVSNKFDETDLNEKVVDIERFQSIVGALLYLSSRTRPDLAFAVSNVSKYCSRPTEKHWIALKRILRYLKGTINYGLVYDKNNVKECEGYSDADWAGDRVTRRSTSGFCFMLGGALISWRSNRQTCVALSTAESEYIALAGASQEAVWLRNVLSELDFHDGSPMLIYGDNQSSLCLAKSSRQHNKSKHVDIKYHYIRDAVAHNKVLLKYCPTSDMLADIFTKGLSSERFARLRSSLGIISID